MSFGKHLKSLREARGLSLRKLAAEVGVTASYLSQVESDSVKPPSENMVKKLAGTLDEHPDVLLAIAGRVSDDLMRVIIRRPKLMGELLRQIDSAPDCATLRVIREVRDGKW